MNTKITIAINIFNLKFLHQVMFFTYLAYNITLFVIGFYNTCFFKVVLRVAIDSVFWTKIFIFSSLSNIFSIKH